MDDELPFTTTTLLAAASDTLEAGGYARIADELAGEWPVPGVRIYEDPYAVAALVIYDTWHQLGTSWTDAQAALVDLISTHFNRADAKSWDGYLVLFTPSLLPREAQLDAADIRGNTTHVRKLVATGDEMKEIADVERALLPLLPLPRSELPAEGGSALDLLPELLGQRGIEREAVQVLIDAFRDQQPLVEMLHACLHRRNDPPDNVNAV